MSKFKNIESVYYCKSVLRRRSGTNLVFTEKTLKILYLCYLFFFESRQISIKNLIEQAAKDGNGEFNARNTRDQLNKLEDSGLLTSRPEKRRAFEAKVYFINNGFISTISDIEKGIEKWCKLGM